MCAARGVILDACLAHREGMCRARGMSATGCHARQRYPCKFYTIGMMGVGRPPHSGLICLILRYEKPYSPMVSHISSHFETNCLILRHSLASNVPGVSDSVSLYRSSHYSKSLFSNTQQADIEADAADMLSHISGVL